MSHVFRAERPRIFALTKQYTDSEVYEGWDDIKKYYTMPIKLINSAVAPDMKNIPTQYGQWRYPCRKMRKSISVIKSAPTYTAAKSCGVISISTTTTRPFQSLFSSLPDTVRTHTARFWITLPLRTYLSGTGIYLSYGHLDGKEVAREELENLAWQMGWDSGQKLRLYKLSFTEGTNSDVLFDFIFMTINNCQTPQIVFPYQKSIIVITKDTGKKLAEPFLTLQMVMQEDKYLCGVSFPFDNLQLITYAYFQASFSLDMERKNGRSGGSYIYYDDCAFTGLIPYVRQNLEYKAFILPSLIELYELDRETGTEYYKTLSAACKQLPQCQHRKAAFHSPQYSEIPYRQDYTDNERQHI